MALGSAEVPMLPLLMWLLLLSTQALADEIQIGGEAPAAPVQTQGMGIDPNVADAEALVALPGIGPAKAQAIIRYRLAHGPFVRPQHLERVPGIGPSTLANLLPHIAIGDLDEAREAIAFERTVERPPPGPVVDVNTADLRELQQLPGIGPSKAQAILDDRNQRGPFRSCQQLERVRGVGPATVEGLAEVCTASQPARRR